MVWAHSPCNRKSESPELTLCCRKFIHGGEHHHALCQSVDSIAWLVAEDQVLRLHINYLMSDFQPHALAGVLQKVRAAN